MPLRLDLNFSIEVENLIIHDSLFRKFISQIEKGLNEFIELNNIKFENKIFLEEDWEIPDCKKLILSINFKRIHFEQEMKSWKIISDLIHKGINLMISYSSDKNIAKLKELNKKFFIKLDF